jgi:hypothetical protein
MTDFIVMPASTRPTAQGVDVNAEILAGLDKLNDAHLATKPIFFAKGLPFYTCIDSDNDLWTRELPNGQITLVKRHFDSELDDVVDIFVRKIK